MKPIRIVRRHQMQAKITTAYLRTQRNEAIESGMPIYMHDTELRGFGCYINAKGNVSWFVQRWVGGEGGTLKRAVIGHLASMPIDQARRQAIIDLGKIAEGEDISLRKKALLEKQKQIVQAKTLGQLFDIYVTTR